MIGDFVKIPLTTCVNKCTVNSDSVCINYIRCQNVTIRRKNKEKELREKILDGEKELLLEARYIPYQIEFVWMRKVVAVCLKLVGSLEDKSPSWML